MIKLYLNRIFINIMNNINHSQIPPKFENHTDTKIKGILYGFDYYLKFYLIIFYFNNNKN